jgi:hypothetical protein
MKHLADLSVMNPTPAQGNVLLYLGDGRETEVSPGFLRHHVAGEILDVEALHEEDDDVVVFIVESGVERVEMPLKN